MTAINKIKALTKLADENTVHLKWIKAHTGHWGNKKAEELAKTVSSNLVCSLVPLNHIKNMINDKFNSLTHERWNTNRHAHTDLILNNHHTKTLKILTNNLNNRTRYRTFTELIGLTHLTAPTVPTLRKQ